VTADLGEAAGDVGDQAVLLLGGHQPVELTGLEEVVVLGVLRGGVGAGVAGHGERRRQRAAGLERAAVGVGLVVLGVAALGGRRRRASGLARAVVVVGLVVLGVAARGVGRHAVGRPVVARAAGHVPRGVDRELGVVDAEAVAVCVGVGEQPALEHLVGRGADA